MPELPEAESVDEESRAHLAARYGHAAQSVLRLAQDAPELGARISPELPVRPDSFYGVGKACGENLGRLYADKHGLHVVCACAVVLQRRAPEAAGGPPPESENRD